MKFENTEVFNFEGALRGMRLPMQSSSKADSHYCTPNECINCKYYGKEPEIIGKGLQIYTTCAGDEVDWTPYKIGENDMDLAQRLIKASNPHEKFMRQILVSMDIQANLKWWAQMDQYKIGTVTDSESVMHTIAKFQITRDCFEQLGYDDSLEIYDGYTIGNEWNNKIHILEMLRQKYNETKDIRYWKALVDYLPESYLQKRTWTGNYETLRNIILQRRGHKMDFWTIFINHLRSFPYAKELLFYGLENSEK